MLKIKLKLLSYVCKSDYSDVIQVLTCKWDIKRTENLI